MGEVHFQLGTGSGQYACGSTSHQAAGSISSTAHKAAVTCPMCMETPAYQCAVQKLPAVQGGPYRYA